MQLFPTVGLALAACTLTGAVAVLAQAPASKGTSAAAAKVAPARVAPAPLPPLPDLGYAPARPLATTKLAYEFAARHPEVIKYVPCYCGCERNGHGSNESCFIKSRDAKGQVAWDPHGWGCTICIDVAADAARMHASGATPVSIRAAIDRKYASSFPSSTPTPKPAPKTHQH